MKRQITDKRKRDIIRNMCGIVVPLAAAGALLLSCSKDRTDLIAGSTPRAVGFGMYSGGVCTKGTAVEPSDIIGTASPSAAGAGMGVFAFMQEGSEGQPVKWNSHKHASPGFMNNQQVAPTTPGSSSDWSYSPVKYWPTDENDRVSFFAYAPYESSKTWADLGIATNTAGTVMTASVPVHDTKADMKDVLWANPVLDASSSYGTVTFSFRHLLSRVSIAIAADNGTTPAGAKAWTDANTTITVDRIVFTSLADSYELSCPLGGTLTDAVWLASWTAGSSVQDITLERTSDFDADSSVISTGHYADARYHALLGKEDSKAGYLFLAPQTFTAGVQTVSVTYTVTTTDSVNPSNSSTKKNTVTRDMSTILSSGLESGKAYNLKFLLNPKSVSIGGGIDTWDDSGTGEASF